MVCLVVGQAVRLVSVPALGSPAFVLQLADNLALGKSILLFRKDSSRYYRSELSK